MFAALLALFAGVAHADPASRTAPAEIHPALFVARDADSTLYLFGTVHVRPRGAPWGGPEARAALDSAEEIWTEIEISPQADAQAIGLIASLGMAPSDRPLTSRLTPEERVRLAAIAQRAGVPGAMLDRMQPWLAAVTLSMAPIAEAGLDPQSGVDRAIDALGDAAGKRMRAFETVEQQLRFLANLSEEAQHQMLLDTLEETETGPGELRQMLAAWERGDLDTIERLVVADTRRNYPEMYDVLFKQRNAEWTGVLMRELDGAGTDFVAVGAGHLVGDDSVVAMLRARGVRVERVRIAR